MRWQRIARFAIALFVVGFAIVVFMALRRNKPPVTTTDSPRRDKDAVVETVGTTVADRTEKGKTVFSITSDGSRAYNDGRQVLVKPVIVLPERNGRTITLRSEEAEVIVPLDKSRDLKTAKFAGDVRVDASDGLLIRARSADYDDVSGIVTIPGPVQFARGRMKGSGVGATYDRNRDVLWLLENAKITVAPDDKRQGALDAKAGAAGLARGEHYVKLTGAAHLVGDGRTIDANEITMQLTADDQKIQSMQLRGQSRITGSGNGPQSMAANDIDLTYGEDGRALQNANLIENAVVQLAGAGRGPGRRITGRTITIAMSPDGATVTNLNANERVEVVLPAEGDQPAKRIRSATLVAAGAPGTGLQEATFDGNVEYRETRAARRNVSAVNRQLTATKLIAQTQPGLGAIQQADFRGNVKFVDGATKGAAPRVLYRAAQDGMDLSPHDAEPGPTPNVDDGMVFVEARTITLGLTDKKLRADTKVRSFLQPGKRDGTSSRLPSMLKQDEPVSVTANRLEYDGSASLAKYTGSAALWQGQTSINGDAITVDDKSGNLTAEGQVRTVMFFDDTDPKTKQKKSAQTIATAHVLFYEDAKRLATYTSGDTAQAHIVGPQGDVTADKIRLFIKQGANELERAEADGNVVTVEGPRRAKGDHLTYTSANETYVMTGRPVEVVEQTPPNCKKTVGTTLTFRRATDNVLVEGIPGVLPMEATPIPCDPARRD